MVPQFLLLFAHPPVAHVGLGVRANDLPTSFIPGGNGGEARLTPRTKLLIALPLIAVFVIVLLYFQLFASPVAIAVIFVLYVAVSLRNRKRFRKQKGGSQPSVSG